MARLGIDEDLVPSSGSQCRPPLPQRVRCAHEPDGVERVFCECPVCGMGGVDPGESVPPRVGVEARVRARLARQVVVRAQGSAGMATILELDEDGMLQDPPEPGEVGEESRGDCRLAVTDGKRSELSQDDVVRDPEGRGGADGSDPRDDVAAAPPQPVEDVVHLPRERNLGRVERVEPAAFRRGVAHPDVVDVGLQDRQARYEFPAVVGPRRQERAVGQGRKFEGSDSDVARVDDPVIGEEGRVQIGPGGQRAVDGHRLQGRDLFHRDPESVFEDRPDVLGHVAVDRRE